jgi:hypothetical protein
MSEVRNTAILREINTPFRAEEKISTDAERAWIEQAIQEGLASPPSKLSVAEIMAAERAAIG